MRCVTGVNVLVVNNDLPIKSIAELIDYAKKNPGKLNYAEASASQRLSAEMFNKLAGVKIERVPYKASPQALGDVISGQVQVMFPDLPQALTQIDAGKVRGLGIDRPAAHDGGARPAGDRRDRAGLFAGLLAGGVRPGRHAQADPEDAVRRHRRGAEGSGDRQGHDPGPHGDLAAAASTSSPPT